MILIPGRVLDVSAAGKTGEQPFNKLRDDNARLKSIINNDSSNSSLPPSTDQKGGKPANTYSSRTKSGRKAGGQRGHKGTTLTKADIEEKIRSGKCRHEICTIGDPSGNQYVTKYIVDLEVIPRITEIHIYAEEDHTVQLPQYVIYVGRKSTGCIPVQRGGHVE